MKPDDLVHWTLPRRAAELFFETLQMDSESSMFDRELRKEIAAALSTVTETNPSENQSHHQNMESLSTITFGTDGNARCLWTEAIPLHELGSLEVCRASTIEFNPQKQKWEVQVNAEVLFENTSRAVCLAWEVQHFNR